MFEGSMKNTGWGYIGSDKKGFEWMFTPNPGDPAYCVDPSTGRCYPFCCVRSGDVFPDEPAAVKNGKKWMKEAKRSGEIMAVKSETERLEY